MTPYFQDEYLTLYHGDCMDLMATLPDKAFDLAIVDPPYGIGEGQTRVNQRSRSTDKWKSAKPPQYGGGEWDDERPCREYFLEVFRVNNNQIVWGANYFLDFLAPSPCIICWHKKRNDEVNDFSDFELAWGSFKTAARLFQKPWIGFGAVNAKENRIHPTQKPVALYKWLLQNYAKPGQRILDTHLGSGSHAIACRYMGFHLTAIEKDPDYVRAAVERYKRETAQGDMFTPKPVLEAVSQTSLF